MNILNEEQRAKRGVLAMLAGKILLDNDLQLGEGTIAKCLGKKDLRLGKRSDGSMFVIGEIVTSDILKRLEVLSHRDDSQSAQNIFHLRDRSKLPDILTEMENENLITLSKPSAHQGRKVQLAPEAIPYIQKYDNKLAEMLAKRLSFDLKTTPDDQALPIDSGATHFPTEPVYLAGFAPYKARPGEEVQNAVLLQTAKLPETPTR